MGQGQDIAVLRTTSSTYNLVTKRFTAASPPMSSEAVSGEDGERREEQCEAAEHAQDWVRSGWAELARRKGL